MKKLYLIFVLRQCKNLKLAVAGSVANSGKCEKN